MTHKFEYVIDLKHGYRPVMETEEVTEVRFVVEASCFASANRMVKALLKDAPNVTGIISACID